jgi:hypothetical protein
VPETLADSPVLARLLKQLSDRAHSAQPVLALSLTADTSSALSAEAYELDASGSQLLLRASDATGLRHALHTLCQWLELHPGDAPCPGITVQDEPDLPERGVMIDCSRDRVPTLATACSLVERLASWKINRLQLYIEHTFAYPGAEAVWGQASPWTPEELQALDSHAAAHGIELVPNQQCFGHMHRWLIHPAYNHLAEVPAGVYHPFHADRQPFSLCPTDPECLEFLEALFDAYLPNFQSATFNVGLDETFDLGQGRSKQAVAANGTGRVYLDFLRSVHDLVNARGKRMQFWADIVLQRPELVPELPPDCEPILWGYEADHPLDSEAATLAASCPRFQIAPGTSSWQALGGRTDNCISNIRSASAAARNHGAAGLITTDWGDRGHLQPLPISYLGFLHGAEAAWNGPAAEARSDSELAALLDQHAYRAPDSGLGAHTLAIGRASDACAVPTRNLATLFFPIGFPDRSLPDDHIEGLDQSAVERARGSLRDLRSEHATLQAHGVEACQSRDELAWVLDLMDSSCDILDARLNTPPGSPLEAIPAHIALPIAERLRALSERHADLWLVRCRPGGLIDSVDRLTRIATTMGSPNP